MKGRPQCSRAPQVIEARTGRWASLSAEGAAPPCTAVSLVVRRAMRGQRVVLTYRGKPVVRLEPVAEVGEIREDDPIYGLAAHAEAGGGSLTNEQIDEIVYGR